MIEPKLGHPSIWPSEQYCYTIERYRSTPFISSLSTILVNLPHQHTKFSKEEILCLMDNYLHEYDHIIHLQLFDSFLDHHLIIQESDSISISVHPDQANDASGVFTPLTKCYSSSCQIDGLSCYSSLCPNNKGQSKMLQCVNNSEYNSKKKTQGSVKDMKKTYNKLEMKRRAAISELLTTECNYCQDLAILDEIYAIPLLESEEIIANKPCRQRFYHTVFGNYLEITQLHKAFYTKAAGYWRSGTYCGSIGKHILDHVTLLVEPYLTYTAHHTKSVHCLTVEQRYNKGLTDFLNTQDKRQCTRRLGIYHYLTYPTLWIGKFKLLVEAILKNTVSTEAEAEDEEDRTALKSSVAILHNILLQMNQLPITTAKELRQEELLMCIYVHSSKSMQLKLLNIPDNSCLVEEDSVKVIRANHPPQYTISHIFLFSHALIVAQPRIKNGRPEYVVLSGFPISIQMLFIDHILSTSFMRRLSLATTSIMSNSYQRISSIRNPDSVESGTETNKPIHESAPGIPERSTSFMMKQIKQKLLRLRTTKNQPSLSAPVSPVSSDFQPDLIRRGSEPLLLKNAKQKSFSNENKTIKVGHRAYPELTFQILFDSRIKKEGWKGMLTDKIQLYAQKNLVEMQQLTGQSLIELSIPPCSTSIATTFSSSILINEESSITCACSFMLAVKDGLIIGSDAECSKFIPLPFIRKLSVIDNNQNNIIGLVALIGHQLVEYSIEELLMNNTENSCHHQGTFISRNVSCFTVGKIKNQAVVFYVTREQVLILNTPERMEFKITIKDPISIQWLDPLVMIQSSSNQNDIEYINLTDHKRSNTFKISTGPLIGCAPLDRHHGILSNSYCSWFYSNNQPDKRRKTIEYESHVNHIAVCHSYLFCFSTFVIEIRSLETTNLLQVIQGYHIRYLTHTASCIYFTMSTQLYKIQIRHGNVI